MRMRRLVPPIILDLWDAFRLRMRCRRHIALLSSVCHEQRKLLLDIANGSCSEGGKHWHDGDEWYGVPGLCAEQTVRDYIALMNLSIEYYMKRDVAGFRSCRSSWER